MNRKFCLTSVAIIAIISMVFIASGIAIACGNGCKPEDCSKPCKAEGKQGSTTTAQVSTAQASGQNAPDGATADNTKACCPEAGKCCPKQDKSDCCPRGTGKCCPTGGAQGTSAKTSAQAPVAKKEKS